MDIHCVSAIDSKKEVDNFFTYQLESRVQIHWYANSQLCSKLTKTSEGGFIPHSGFYSDSNSIIDWPLMVPLFLLNDYF